MATAKEAELKRNEIQSEALKAGVDQLEKEVEEAEKRADEAQEEEDKMFEEFSADMRRELEKKMTALQHNARASVNLDDMHSKLLSGIDDSRTGVIQTKQTDILRTNKVIRDISRALGTDWKGIFRYLMAAKFSKAEIEEHAQRIERLNKPMTQAYKALLMWRDTKEPEMGLTQLADGLRVNKKEELADYVLDTLECEGDALFKLNLTVSGDSTQKSADTDKPEAAAAANGETKQENGEGGKEEGTKPRPKPPLQKNVSSIGVLDDRKFLQLAKKIGPEWKAVATTLGLDEEDIAEIMEGEGATYQGGFKMLWTWRDRTIELNQDNAQILREALKASGKDDAAEIV